MQTRAIKPEEYLTEEEPYYQPTSQEVAVFEAAYRNGLPVLLEGPTGSGKLITTDIYPVTACRTAVVELSASVS